MVRLLPVFALALVTGCANNFDDVDFGAGYYGGDSNVEARLAGQEMPHVGSFADDSRSGWFHDYDGWVDLGVESYGEYGWAMLMVSGESGEGGIVDVIGCTGKDDGYAEFDEPAEESEVTFTPREVDGEEVVEVSIEARFADGSTASASGLITPM